MAKPLGRGGLARRDRGRDGKLKPRNKCRVWELSVKMDDGTRPTRKFHGSYTEELDALPAFVEEVSGRGSGGTLGELLERWHERRVPALARNTVANEESRVKCLVRLIGSMDVREVTPEDVERVYSRLMSGESLSGKPLSTRSVAPFSMTMNSFFDDLVRDGVVVSNPVTRATRPRAERAERRFMMPDEVDALMSRLDFSDPRQRAVTIICACGLRRGEAVALKGRDWDGRALSVSRADDGAGGIKRPKTAAGVRSVPSPPGVAESLDALGLSPDEWVCPDERGQMMKASSLGDWWHDARASFGCNLTLHELRHSYATRLAVKGVSPRVAQKLMGHSSIAVTMSVYTHVSDYMEDDAVMRAFS